MGGDHKCPVCQATFTRPQHVARHMRSHTGDRPYKCQHCGDQFARSDLLSRHVNKCHANEKPLAPAGGRRKGSASATRATTSKQACDQCVQSSLPCDGANPCAKCIQRKCRCTFVKFHRQTAPAGPGHNRPANVVPPSAVSTSARAPLFSQPEDDFILGPPPVAVPTMSTTMAETLLNSNSFAFPPLYPQADISVDDGDFSRFRAHADLFPQASRQSLGTALSQGLYDSRPSTASSWVGWDQEDAFHQQNQRHSDLLSQAPSLMGPSSSATMHDKHSQASLAPRNQQNQTSFMVASQPFLLRSNHQLEQARPGSVDFDLSGSEGAHSLPSSAASSSVHLPLEGVSLHRQAPYPTSFDVKLSVPDRASTSSASSASSHSSYSLPGASAFADDGRQDFSSTFGLMSLDDPAVLAGMASDGPQFFSEVHPQEGSVGQSTITSLPLPDQSATQPSNPDMDTPVPSNKRNSGQLHIPPLSAIEASSKEANGSGTHGETRDMRDLWRQYMSTPLTGSGPGEQAGGAHGMLSKGTPTPTHRRPRVSSFPSSKTPRVDSLYNSHHPHHVSGAGTQQHSGGSDENSGLGPTSSMRTTLHNEDLRSYEAAVMARQMPTTLNLTLRKPGRKGSHSASQSPQVPHAPMSFAYGRSQTTDTAPPAAQQLQQHAARMYGLHGDQASPSSSRDPPDDLSDPLDKPREDNERLTGGESVGITMPSFKRNPSQTLEPTQSKRMFLGRGEDDDDRVVGWLTAADLGEGEGLGLSSTSSTVPQAQCVPVAMPMAIRPPDAGLSLSERRRKRGMTVPALRSDSRDEHPVNGL